MAFNKSNDAPHAAGHPGELSLGVRRDADTTPVSTDGDYHHLVFDDTGNLKVTVKSTVATGGGTEFDDGDTIDTDSQGKLLIATTGISGTARAVRCEDDGAIHIADGGDSLTVDNATISVVGGGAEATAQRVTIANDSTGLLSVDDNGSSLTVDTTGTSGLEVVQPTAADLNVTEASAANSLTALQIIDDWDATHDSAAPADGAMTLLESKDFDGSALPNAVGTEGDAVRPAGSLSGIQYIMPVNEDGSKEIFQEEDVAHVSGDLGQMVLAIREDSGLGVPAVSFVGAAGDYAPLQVSTQGILKTTDYGSEDGYPNLYSNVLNLVEIPSTVIGDSANLGLAGVNAISGLVGELSIGGGVDHDSADSAVTDNPHPVKIGARAFDYHPNTDEEQPASYTEVAENDRTNIHANIRGQLIEGINSRYHVLENISDTYDNVTTTNVSSDLECWNYRQCTIGFELDKANTPTDILIEIETSMDGTNFSKMMNDWLGNWIYDDTAVGSGIEENLTFPIACQEIRVRVTATGTTAVNTFTMANAQIYLRN